MALYIIQGMFVLCAVGAATIYGQCRDGGFIVLCLVFSLSAGASIVFASLVPLFIGGVIAGLMIFIGSGGLSVHD